MNGSNINNNKSRDADCCSVKFVKNVLHIFNIIFFVSTEDKGWKILFYLITDQLKSIEYLPLLLTFEL